MVKSEQQRSPGFDKVPTMTISKTPLSPAARLCPVCHQTLTKIQRKLSNDKHGSTTYVCARIDCALGIDLRKVDTWIIR
jgi:hypothetical protein